VLSVRSGNYSNMLGFGQNEHLTEYLRLYIALHGDHEGGNASAHTAREYSSASMMYLFLMRIIRPRRINAL
jgi:citrate synthase